MIWKIAKKELQLLFFSPVAWFLLVVFTIQAGMLFVGRYHDYMKTNEFGNGIQFMVSFSLFVRALWGQVSMYLYFYIHSDYFGEVLRNDGIRFGDVFDVECICGCCTLYGTGF